MRDPRHNSGSGIVSGVATTLGVVNDESELAGVAGELTTEEAAALRDASIHPVLRGLAQARLDRSEDD